MMNHLKSFAEGGEKRNQWAIDVAYAYLDSTSTKGGDTTIAIAPPVALEVPPRRDISRECKTTPCLVATFQDMLIQGELDKIPGLGRIGQVLTLFAAKIHAVKLISIERVNIFP